MPEDNASIGVVLERITSLSSDIREMRAEAKEESRARMAMSLRIERLASDVDNIRRTAETLSDQGSKLSEMDIRLSLVEQTHEDDNRENLGARVQKLEGAMMRVAGAMTAMAVIWAIAQGVMRIIGK